jgi:hypothetical protein
MNSFVKLDLLLGTVLPNQVGDCSQQIHSSDAVAFDCLLLNDWLVSLTVSGCTRQLSAFIKLKLGHNLT